MSFEVGDLQDVLQPTLHVDQFKSKLGRDDKNCVISFAVDDRLAANDLVDFLERGYEFVLDASVSNSEVSNGRYLVFMEIRRLTSLFDHVEKVLKDLSAASGFKLKQWQFKFMKDKQYQPMTRYNFESAVPLTAKNYRKRYVDPINDMKTVAGLPVTTPPVQDADLKQLQNLAGI
jgi:hypothetical protein